jgi:hypothetical protein
LRAHREELPLAGRCCAVVFPPSLDRESRRRQQIDDVVWPIQANVLAGIDAFHQSTVGGDQFVAALDAMRGRGYRKVPRARLKIRDSKGSEWFARSRHQ